jgi:hypothetical protein
MMAERGLALAHTTIMRWVQRFVPEFEKRWNRVARKAGRSWRVDETCVKIRGKWTYLYRAVDAEAAAVRLTACCISPSSRSPMFSTLLFTLDDASVAPLGNASRRKI